MKYHYVNRVIEIWREKLGISERQLCANANLKPDAIRSIRRGSSPQSDVLPRVADALGIPRWVLIDALMLDEYKANKYEHLIVPTSDFIELGKYIPPAEFVKDPDVRDMLGPAKYVGEWFGKSVEETYHASISKPDPLPILGKVQAKAWLEEGENTPRQKISNILPSDRYSAFPQFCFEVAGPSMDQYLLDGDIAACVDLRAYSRDLEQGDIIVLKRSRVEGGLHEWSLRQVETVKPHGIKLWSRSYSDQYDEPVVLEKPEPGIVNSVLALVLGFLRPFPDGY